MQDATHEESPALSPAKQTAIVVWLLVVAVLLALAIISSIARALAADLPRVQSWTVVGLILLLAAAVWLGRATRRAQSGQVLSSQDTGQFPIRETDAGDGYRIVHNLNTDPDPITVYRLSTPRLEKLLIYLGWLLGRDIEKWRRASAPEVKKPLADDLRQREIAAEMTRLAIQHGAIVAATRQPGHAANALSTAVGQGMASLFQPSAPSHQWLDAPKPKLLLVDKATMRRLESSAGDEV